MHQERKIYIQVGFREPASNGDSRRVEEVSMGIGHTARVIIETEQSQPLSPKSASTLCFTDCKASYLTLQPIGQEIIYCIDTDAAVSDEAVCESFYMALQKEGHPVTAYRQVFPVSDPQTGGWLTNPQDHAINNRLNQGQPSGCAP